MNTDLVEENVHRLLGAMTGAATTAMVAVGDQLGLYRALAEGGSASPGELAARTGTAERYVREWLSQQAAAGFVAYRDGDGRYALPAEAAAVLANEASPVFLAGGATLTRGWFAGVALRAESPSVSRAGRRPGAQVTARAVMRSSGSASVPCPARRPARVARDHAGMYLSNQVMSRVR
jgi:Rv2258c-like winged HTH domain